MKDTQISRVIRTLKETGEVSRNQFLDLEFDKITRLGAIICLLRRPPYNFDITTHETKKDTIYKIHAKRVERYRIPETGEVFTKTIWA